MKIFFILYHFNNEKHHLHIYLSFSKHNQHIGSILWIIKPDIESPITPNTALFTRHMYNKLHTISGSFRIPLLSIYYNWMRWKFCIRIIRFTQNRNRIIPIRYVYKFWCHDVINFFMIVLLCLHYICIFSFILYLPVLHCTNVPSEHFTYTVVKYTLITLIFSTWATHIGFPYIGLFRVWLENEKDSSRQIFSGSSFHEFMGCQ